MTKHYLTAAAMALMIGLVPAAVAHDDENTVTQSHDLSGYSKIDVNGVYVITLIQGDSFAITTSGAQDEMERMDISVKGDTLFLNRKGKVWKRENGDNHGINAVITLPQLTLLDVTGVAEVRGEDFVFDDIEMDVSGVASVKISGTCNDLEASVNGVGSLDLEDLKCKTGDLAVNGAGSITAYTDSSVKARVNGVGDISVYGSPARVDKNKSWLGSVTIQ